MGAQGNKGAIQFWNILGMIGGLVSLAWFGDALPKGFVQVLETLVRSIDPVGSLSRWQRAPGGPFILLQPESAITTVFNSQNGDMQNLLSLHSIVLMPC